jgi:membrane protein DedA with SNARE-associated domain
MFRFLYGLRTVTPSVMGRSPIPPERFILLNAIGALAWATVIGMGGYLLGMLLEIILREIKHDENEILATIVLVGAIVGQFHFLYRRRPLSSSSAVIKNH